MKAWHAPAGRSNKAKLGRRQGFALHACLHCERGPFPHAHGVQCACCSAQSACQGRGAASKASHSNKRSRGGGTHPQTSHSEKRGSSGPISNSGITCSLVGPMGVMYCSMPPRMISHLRARRRPGFSSKQAERCVPKGARTQSLPSSVPGQDRTRGGLLSRLQQRRMRFLLFSQRR